MQKILSERLETLSAENIQTALQLLRERLNQSLGQRDWLIAKMDYGIMK